MSLNLKHWIDDGMPGHRIRYAHKPTGARHWEIVLLCVLLAVVLTKLA